MYNKAPVYLYNKKALLSYNNYVGWPIFSSLDSTGCSFILSHYSIVIVRGFDIPGNKLL